MAGCFAGDELEIPNIINVPGPFCMLEMVGVQLSTSKRQIACCGALC
jgi:hypothetical protein